MAGQFPLIRVFATIGWIVIGLVVGFMAVEKTATPFLLAAGCSVVMGLFSLTLPHTPPAAKGQPASVRTILGLDALVMLKERSFLVFVIASVLACIPLTFYFSFTNAYLNEVGVANAAGKMTLGQFSEIGMMLLMPLIYRRVNLKAILLMGLLAWSVRYLFLAIGNAGELCLPFLRGDPVARRLLRLLLHDRTVVHGSGSAAASCADTAQGFIQFLTYGVGMFLGSMLSGVAVDLFTHRVRRERDAQLVRLLDDFGCRRVRDLPAGGGCVQIEPGHPSSAARSSGDRRLARLPAPLDSTLPQ